MSLELSKRQRSEPRFSRSDRRCNHWWFGAWDGLVNSVLLLAGRPDIVTAPGEIAFDPHLHSLYSRCSVSDPVRLIREARRIGLGAIGLMDHNCIQGALITRDCADYLKSEGELPEDFLVVPGLEINSKAGHIGALFVEQDIPMSLSAKETVDRIHDIGGLAVAVHPFHSTGIGEAVFDLPFDAIEIECGSVFDKRLAMRNRELANNADLKHAAKLGSSDAHYIYATASCYTIVKDIEKPSIESLKQAIMAGNAQPCTSVPYQRLSNMLGKIRKLG
ncbi:MAG: hypothetical protein ACOX3G_01505 [Armatimonadota bacterium]|jgi:predicted metal-dependent phosphoesterase TrpH